MQPLVKLIDRYRPGFAGDVAPASPELVEELATVAGPLPGAYVRFLQAMGGNMGGFQPFGANFDADDVVLNYQINKSLHGSPLLFIAAEGPLQPGGNLFLDREKPSARDDCLLVVVPSERRMDATKAEPFHAGLEEFLYYSAYHEIRLGLLPARTTLAPTSEKEPTNDDIRRLFEVAARLGFERVPPATHNALFERGDAAMLMYRYPLSEDYSLQIAAEDAGELRRMVGIFTDQMPMRRIA